MPGLNPKIALHRLAIKRGVGPKKQSQRRFSQSWFLKLRKKLISSSTQFSFVKLNIRRG
ncbi:unnamed protein product [Rhodiola kirilowii]